MNRYSAIFFDRDGVLSRYSPAIERKRDEAISRIIGCSFHLTDDIQMACFRKASQLPGLQPINTLAKENHFWLRWFEAILTSQGITAGVEQHARNLFADFCFYRCQVKFPEVAYNLRLLQDRGYRLGVICNTFPSLKASIEFLEIEHYFSSYTASSLVGANKPDPRIFCEALLTMGVMADESIFVDDSQEDADAARAQGFTAFHMDRTLLNPDYAGWKIGNIEHLVQWLERQPRK